MRKAQRVELPVIMLTGQELVQDIYVADKFGAFTTNKIRGHTASCTSGAKEAAERMAGKLYGPALRSVVEVDPGNKFARLFRATADPIIYAWCWATGLIEFGDKVPDDALELAYGPERALRAAFDVSARHGRGASAGKLLVPGVPEAESQREGLRAVQVFCVWRARNTNDDRDSFGVMFFPYTPSAVETLRLDVNKWLDRKGLSTLPARQQPKRAAA